MNTAKATRATVASGTGPPRRSSVCRPALATQDPSSCLPATLRSAIGSRTYTLGRNQRDQEHRPIDDPGLFGRHHQRRGDRSQNQISRPPGVVVLQSGDDNSQCEKDEQRFVDEIAREINRAGRDCDQPGRRERRSCPSRLRSSSTSQIVATPNATVTRRRLKVS